MSSGRKSDGRLFHKTGVERFAILRRQVREGRLRVIEKKTENDVNGSVGGM